MTSPCFLRVPAVCVAAAVSAASSAVDVGLGLARAHRVSRSAIAHVSAPESRLTDRASTGIPRPLASSRLEPLPGCGWCGGSAAVEAVEVIVTTVLLEPGWYF